MTVLTTSNTLIPSIPHLYRLANYPITIHVSLLPASFPDYSEIAAIRQAGITILRSDSIQEAQDMAITAHGVAIKGGKAVVHFFEPSNNPDENPIPVEDGKILERTLDRSAVSMYQDELFETTNIYAGDGVRAHLPITTTRNGTTNGTSENNASPKSPTLTNGHDINGTNGVNGNAKTNGVHENGTGRRASHSSNAPVENEGYRNVNSDDIFKYIDVCFEIIKQVTGRSYHQFDYYGPTNAENVIFLFGSNLQLFRTTIAQASNSEEYVKVGIITARVYRPWYGTRLLDIIPKSVKKIAVLEQIKKRTTRWGPVFMDILTSLRTDEEAKSRPQLVGYQLGYVSPSAVKLALRGVLQNLKLETPIQNLEVGLSDGPSKAVAAYITEQPDLEQAYMKILDQTFGSRLHIANTPERSSVGVSAGTFSSPEYGFGSLLARLERKQDFIKQIEIAAKSNSFATTAPNDWLAKWLLCAHDAVKSVEVADELIIRLQNDGSSLSRELLDSKISFYSESPWLIGSDAWAYDLGNSGVHHVLASGKNINMLIIDSQPYSDKAVLDSARRKKDIGLYAMNYGNAYVASVAVYSSYTGVLHAMIEAEKFDGPSIIMAYLPYNKEDDSPLTVLQETKKAVDIGYWPLYRWNPYREEKEGLPNFELDSERIKSEVKEFLKRDNHLSKLMRRNPVLAANLSESYGTEVRNEQKRKAKDAYTSLLEGLEGAPLTILYASDGGNGENLSKRLQRRAKARGLKAVVMAMDDYPIEDLGSEENIVFVTSVAGQGEFPQNGKGFWETIKNSTDIDLAAVNFSVFGLGDSHYWPRKEDRIYYNKPCKDLDARLELLSGKRFVDMGLGDDQDPDGYQTAYGEWEPKLWVALGVDKVEGIADEPPPITNEDIKIASNFLRGTINEGLEDLSTMAISAPDQQLTKFHGTYMQDDRDLRDERKAQGLEPAYAFMIRCRLAGGVATPKQWIQMDDISNSYGNETMKLTTRQTFQV